MERFGVFSVLVLLVVYYGGYEGAAEARLADPTEEPVHAVTTAEATAAPVTEPPFINLECFHQPESVCESFKNSSKVCRCKRLLPHYPQAVVCCDVESFFLTEGLACAGVGPTAEVQALHIRNATLDVLNITQSSWKRLKSMSVTDGHIKRVTGVFPKMTSISCLNLSNNGLTEIEPRALVKLYNLTALDLSHNQLDTLPKFGSGSANLTLDISNNKPLQCSNLKEAMGAKKELIFQNPNDTFCLSSKSFHWFNSTERVPLTQVEHIVELELLCPKVGNQNCACLPHRLDIVPGKPPTFAVKVDCSNRNLTTLPKELPPYTIVLNVSYNKIASLSMLSDEPCYKDIRELYADHNEITSILKFEGTKFIDNFAVLSLRGNKIDTLPTYFLSHIFDRNWNPRFVNLGLNKLHCDCKTINILKVWLPSKQKNIPDYNEIMCANIPKRVMDVDKTKVCQSPRHWTDYIYYIITAEVLLLVGLICKVSYDYWVFKSAGYLPWPASKMPKLPCDWLCES